MKSKQASYECDTAGQLPKVEAGIPADGQGAQSQQKRLFWSMWKNKDKCTS